MVILTRAIGFLSQSENSYGVMRQGLEYENRGRNQEVLEMDWAYNEKPRTNVRYQALRWNPQGKRGRPRSTWGSDLKTELREVGSN